MSGMIRGISSILSSNFCLGQDITCRDVFSLCVNTLLTEIMSPVLPGNCKEKEKLKGSVPQIAREKHK